MRLRVDSDAIRLGVSRSRGLLLRLRHAALSRALATCAILAVFLFSFAAQNAGAAVYRGIHFATTLAELREMFPNASITALRPAWIQKNEALYNVSGVGLEGTIVVFFISVGEPAPQDERLVASWVRWIPDQPIPLSRFVALYGVPPISGYDPDDMQPFREWSTLALRAILTPGETAVAFVEYHFTEAERTAGASAYWTRVSKNHPQPAERH